MLATHSFFFIVMLINPTSYIKKILSPKNKIISFLNISSTEIGKIYSLDDLKKYYGIKKLQLFNLIIDGSNKDQKLDSYSNLINNYMFVIQYIKQNIDEKVNNKEDIIKINGEIAYYDENLKLKDEENIIEKNQLQITGDISYNQSFITKYEIYNDYSLIKNL